MTADKWTDAVLQVQPVPYARQLQHAIKRHRPRKPLDRERTERFDDEPAADKVVGGFRDHHRADRGQGLRARRHVRRFAKRRRLAAGARADLAQNGSSGMNPDARGEPPILAQVAIDSFESRENLECGADRALSIIARGFRPAEVSDNAVAEILRDVSFVIIDGIDDHAMVEAHDLSIVLVLEPRGHLGRADHIAEQDGELPTFTVTLIGMVMKRNSALTAKPRIGRGRSMASRAIGRQRRAASGTALDA